MRNENIATRRFEAVSRGEKCSFSINRTIFIIMVLTIGSLLCSCSKPPESEVTMEKMSLGISRSFMSIPIYIAKEKGFFKEEGLDLTVQEYPSGKLATKAMLAGEIDVSTVADMPIVYNAFKQQDFCVLATFTSSYSLTRMLARKDKGIKTAADLKGRKVGANQRTSSHFYLGAFLTDNQLSMADVEMVQYKTVNLSDALIDDKVDAVSIWQPHDQKARSVLGDAIIDLPSKEIYRATFSFAVKKDFPGKHRTALEKLIRAMDKAAKYSKTHKAESIDIIASALDIEKEIIASSWEGYRFGTFLDQAFLIGLDDIARWAIENEFTDQKNIPDFLDYVCPDILQSIRPKEVTMVY